MSVSIYSSPLGVDRVHIIRGEKTIMIDGGMAGQAKKTQYMQAWNNIITTNLILN